MTPLELLARAPVEFKPLQDFHSDKMQSDYVTGMRYTLRSDLASHYHDPEVKEYLQGKIQDLAICVSQWLAEGKIVLIDRDVNEKQIRGTGFVG